MKKMTRVLGCLVVGMLLINAIQVITFAFEPIPTRMHLQDATFEWHTNESLIAKLTDENGVPLSGKEVWFYQKKPDGWQELGSAVTNESGIANFEIYVTMEDGTYYFKAVFKEDDKYLSSSDIAEVTVEGDIGLVATVIILAVLKLAIGAAGIVVPEWYKQTREFDIEDIQALQDELAIWEDRAIGAPEETEENYPKRYFDTKDRLKFWQDFRVTWVGSAGIMHGNVMGGIMEETGKHETVLFGEANSDMWQFGHILRSEGVSRWHRHGPDTPDAKAGAQTCVLATKLLIEVSKKATDAMEIKESGGVSGYNPTIDFHISVIPESVWYRSNEKVKATMSVVNNRKTKTEIWLGVSFRDKNGVIYDVPGENIAPKPNVEIAPNAVKEFTVEWTIPDSAPVGPYDIAINCWKDDTFIDKYTDDLEWERLFYFPEFHITASPEKVWYQSGEKVVISIDVENLGEDKNIWFDATLMDTQHELQYPDITPDPDNVFVAGDETETFTAEWTIPQDAPLGEYALFINCYKEAPPPDACPPAYANDFDWRVAFYCYSLDIISPTSSSPAIVGDPSHPTEFNAKVTTGIPIPLDLPGIFSAKIDDKSAKVSVVSPPVDPVNGVYMLQITPPTQDSEGQYDLNISLDIGHGVTDYDVETNAVIYSTGANVDVMEIIDRSGSMSGKKIQDAKDAAKLFVDLMRAGDMVGVASYSSSARVDYGLKNIIDPVLRGILSSEQIASLLVNRIDDNMATIMVAIAIAESGGNSEAQGDRFGGKYSCNDYTSFGLWQIHMPAHYDKLERHTGSNDPCVWAEWLKDPHSNAEVALEILATQGLTAWSTYNSGTYETYLSIAEDAVKKAKSGGFREDAKKVIDRISAGGMTSIGAGLRAGYNELVGKGNPAHPWAMILMSDGRHNTAPHPDTVLPDIRDKNIRVFTIGLGAGADASLLSHIAHDSGAGGGEYYFAPSSEGLGAIYNMLAGVVKAESSVKEVRGSLELGETISHKVEIDPTIYMATFTVTWTTGTLELKLIRPDGSEVDPADPDVFHKKEATYETYEIRHPMAGEWTMEITATSTSSSVSYTATVTAGTNLTIHMYTDKDEYLLNEPIKLIAALTKAGEPITEAAVSATVERPDAAIDYLSLYDDGKHGDGIALDGVYANYYCNTNVSGSYTINIYASGTASPELFTREVKKSVYVSGVPTGKISVAPTSWDAGTITPGQDATSVFTVSSTSIADETVTISTTDLADASGNVIKSDNLFGMPSTFIVPAGGSTEFYTRIYVPKDMPTGNYAGSIILMSTVNSVTIPINLTVLILHEVSISITPSTSTIKPGQTSTYTVNVTNLGSIQDTYNLTLTYTDFNGQYRAYPIAIQQSWTTLNPTTLTLNPEESANATLTITIPPEWPGMEDATYNFTVTATCQADPTVNASALTSLTVIATKHSMAEYVKLEIQWLQQAVNGLDIKEGLKNSLLAKLTNAEMKVDQAIQWIDQGREKPANNMLNAAQNILQAFINEVEAQAGKAISPTDAQTLIQTAQKIQKDIQEAKSTL